LQGSGLSALVSSYQPFSAYTFLFSRFETCLHKFGWIQTFSQNKPHKGRKKEYIVKKKEITGIVPF
jgi:hypothetical protein